MTPDDECPECLAHDRDMALPCPVCGVVVLLAAPDSDSKQEVQSPCVWDVAPKGDA